ncbi:MAG: hypothetical protein BHW64_03080 [Candidatus Melainabacteria bacterium LEY3_CP_29_8]|nr:MAG: hypothetical protein BHW64_03080 [Candidatus Melainabacteria bacterium LEY3_CP_29_8]
MKLIKDTLSFILQVLLIIFVNLFVADICVYSVWLVILFLQYDVFVSKALNKEWDEISSIYLLPILMLFMLIYIIKNISLPILYYILEKTSKSKLIKKFINNLKHKFIMKLLVLFLSIIPFLIWNKLNDSLLKKEIWSDFFFFCIVFGLFGSYLFLFFFWEIEKFWRREKEKGNKYICTVCEWCVKVGLKINKVLKMKII